MGKRILFLVFIFTLATAVFTVALSPADATTREMAPVQADGVTLVNAFPNITFKSLVALANAGDERLFAVEQLGRIRVTFPDGDTTTAPVFLDISDRVRAGGERGLLGLAFHPDYDQNGFFYVNYTQERDGKLYTRISRFGTAADLNAADPDSEQILLEIEQPYNNHNGGALAFGPDGYLYIALGDGGGVGDPEDNGQNLDTLLGKILRIDVDGTSNGRNYAIPSDNPFVNQPGLDEIWVYGLRNPWRISFDRETGDLYIGDVGQFMWEEVDFQPADSNGGENYGWRLKEGNHCFDPADNCDPGGLTDPVHDYNHSVGCSVTGGYVYRGERPSSLLGTYIYGDYCGGQIWGLKQASDGSWENAVLAQLASPVAGLTTFGEAANGELYLAQLSGQIYRLVITGRMRFLPVVAR